MTSRSSGGTAPRFTSRNLYRVHIQQINGRGPVFVQPKTARGRRRISLTPTTVELLKAHKARQNEVRLLGGPAWQNSHLCSAQH